MISVAHLHRPNLAQMVRIPAKNSMRRTAATVWRGLSVLSPSAGHLVRRHAPTSTKCRRRSRILSIAAGSAARRLTQPTPGSRGSAQVVATGWDVPGQEKIVSRACGQFVRHPRALDARGSQVYAQLSRHPGTYNRLDRLSTLENGQDTIPHLIEAKQGEDLIIYMATTTGGKTLGKMMAGTQGGVDLNKPTGRIYTADDLLTVLKQIYDATP